MAGAHFPAFQLERWFAEFEFIPAMRNLAASGPRAVTTQELLALEDATTTTRYLNLGLDYIENPGSESLRCELARLYAHLGAQDIRVTAGASEALFLLAWTMVAAGENIVVEEPCYESVVGVAHTRGVEVRKLPLQLSDGWKPDLDQLAQLIDQKTRLIYLVHPHNPTGSLLLPQEMLAIAEMAQRVGALLVNDEVFRPIALDNVPLPSIVDVVEHAVAIGDMTKPWGLGGLRVGWIATRNHEVLQRLSAARDYSTMCGSAPGEFLAEVALRHAAEVIAPRLTAARQNRERLAQAIAHTAGTLQWHYPTAGYTAFVQLPFATEAFCRSLAQEQRILLLPGYVYGPAYKQFIRIGFGCDPQIFQEGLATIMEQLVV